MTSSHRSEAEIRFRDEHGCGVADAALAARALYPFDDGTEPGAAFAKEGRHRADDFAREVAGLRGSEVAVAAERAVEELLDLSRDHREMYYVSIFEDALTGSGPVAPPESGE